MLKYDLEERTAKFGESIIQFCKSLVKDPISLPMITQLLRAGTSVGANYMEANGASSRKDFKNKIFISKKESQECKHWLRMLASYFPDKTQVARIHWQEAHELTLIFHQITKTIKSKG